MALKILIHCDDHGTGGAAAATHRLALGLVQRGHAVVYAQSRSASPRIAEREAAGIVHAYLPYDTIRYFAPTAEDARAPARVILDHQPDLILFSDSLVESALAAKEAAALFGVPYLAIKHLVPLVSAFTREPAITERVRRSFAASSGIVTVSRQNKDLLDARFPDQAGRIEVIHNCVPDAFFAPRDAGRGRAFRAENGIPEGALAVLTPAAVNRRKGFHHQVRLIRRLKEEGRLDRFVFVLAGEEDADFTQPLWAELAAAGCMPQVRRLGFQPDVARCLDGSDVLLLPSEQEGMPLVVLEAMAKGVPVVASAVGGSPEALAGGGGALVADPNQDAERMIAGIAERLTGWAGAPDERAAIGAAGRRNAEAGFRSAAMVDRYDALVRRAVFPAGDYVAPGLELIKSDWALPFVGPVPADRLRPHHRGDPGPHNRYIDTRFPKMPLLPFDRDEALILYNTALRLTGRRALEVGCSFGWVGFHVLAAGMRLDSIDPFLSHEEVRAAVVEALPPDSRGRARLGIGHADTMLDNLRAGQEEGWSLFTIDGRRDVVDLKAAVEACVRNAEADALILLQGLRSPAAAEALRGLGRAGWRTAAYHTTGIIGVAWRGAVAPVEHTPDPALTGHWPAHLGGAEA